jgi:membrane-bound inhibitor of C-type lysozyme
MRNGAKLRYVARGRACCAFGDNSPEIEMSTIDSWYGMKAWRLAAVVAAAGAAGGCLQTAPVVVTPQEQQSRTVYNCPDAKTIDVTRLNDGSAIVVVDGNTLQLARDTSNSSVERYGNRLQTLTLYGGSATFETLGRTRYGPCSGGEAYDGGARRSNRAVKQDNTD